MYATLTYRPDRTEPSEALGRLIEGAGAHIEVHETGGSRQLRIYGERLNKIMDAIAMLMRHFREP